MQRFSWSFQNTGRIAASPESVLAWWLHPDRPDEFMGAVETLGGIDPSVEELTIDEARFRVLRWNDDRGWEHIHSVRIRNDEDNSPDCQGDRFVVPMSDSTEIRHSTGEEVVVKCSGQIEFDADGRKCTEVVVTHNHVLTGGRRRRRRTFPQSQQRDTGAAFDLIVDRCRSALESSSDHET
jgi:hypothetical protein